MSSPVYQKSRKGESLLVNRNVIINFCRNIGDDTTQCDSITSQIYTYSDKAPYNKILKSQKPIKDLNLLIPI